ncbi:MAG: type II toxin-antitoxin system VapC family toxin [Chitinophagaceae bacterium]
MAGQLVLIDTSILIDFYRKTDKANLAWIALIDQDYEFAISTISKYEIYSGATQSQIGFWDSVLLSVAVLAFDESCVDTAVRLNFLLKQKRKQIELADLFIAATAVTQKLSIATLNRKHFERIEELILLD